MSADYRPGAPEGARIDRAGDRWTLVLTRDLRHPPARVWAALTEPAQLAAWAPYDADRPLSTPGVVNLSTVGTPKPHVTPGTITRAEAPRVLEYAWGEQAMRWELEPSATGTRLTLWHTIAKPYIAMGAAGWHICFDVLARLLDGAPIGRIAGPAAFGHDFQRLHADYAKHLGVETPEP